jgi:hypothetical protein
MDGQTTPKKWDEWQNVFLRELARTGVVAAACKKAKVERSTAYNRRKLDPQFAGAWDEALEVATEMLEAEAHRRAAIGVLEPVYQQAMRVGQVRKYSDTLLIFLLKAHKPAKYRDNYRVEHVGANGGPIEYQDAGQRILSRINSIATKFATDGGDSGDSADSGGTGGA